MFRLGGGVSTSSLMSLMVLGTPGISSMVTF